MADCCNGVKKNKERCASWGSYVCEDCGKGFCRHHISRDKHDCDDSVKGTHSIWKYKTKED